MMTTLHYAYIVCVSMLLCVTRLSTLAQTTLAAGDIVVLGFNSDETGPDQKWAFMTMVNLATNTAINFTDYGYDGSLLSFRTGTVTNDGHMRWVTQGPITKGTIIYATNNTVNGSSAGVTGQLGVFGGGYFNTAGDQLIVYQGTLGTATGATFIYALNTGQHILYTGGNGSWITSGTIGIDQTSYLPPGLTNGSTALALTSSTGNTSVGPGTVGTANYGFDNMRYAGTTTGTKSALLAAAGSPANWIGDNAAPYNFTTGGDYPTNAFTVLPVTLLYFKAAEASAGTVQLTWGTAMESNNDHFTIERSADGIHYTVIATMAGKGDHNEPVDYSFIDHQPSPGHNFYRLSQTDRDGREKILGVKTVIIQHIALRVGPNPAMHVIDASFNSGIWREINLYNSAEQLLQTVALKATASYVRIGLKDYAAGMYYLAFVGSNGRTNTVRRFVKR